MNLWLLSATGLMAALVACGIVCFRGASFSRLVGLEAAELVTVLILVALAEGFERPGFMDIALTLALVSFGGALVFARFLERWL